MPHYLEKAEENEYNVYTLFKDTQLELWRKNEAIILFSLRCFWRKDDSA